MKLLSLQAAVVTHTGQLICERIGKPEETKTVDFRHVVTAPSQPLSLPLIGQLTEFYETFGSITFYVDEKSGDAAKEIASFEKWPELHSDFRCWIDQLDEDERNEILPEWIDDCLVIGEEPRTGNYILMPVQGESSGHVFLFDHDGFEFDHCAINLIEYVEKLLSPNDELLLEIATHMRFIDGDPMIQWWIRELKDNRGNVARTWD